MHQVTSLGVGHMIVSQAVVSLISARHVLEVLTL